MTPSEIEDFVVARLRDQLLTGLTVEAAPEDPGQYAVKGAKGCVLVRYISSAYTTPEQYMLVQQRVSRVSVICGARSLRIREGHQGVLDIMQAAIQALTMLKLPDGGRTYVQDDEFIREEKGVWWYGFTLVVPNELHHKRPLPGMDSI